jgi:putative ABC transport system permease protein
LWGSPTAAIGKQLRAPGHSAWSEIVGVSVDVYDNGANQVPPAIIYWPAQAQGAWPNPRSVAFALRTERAGTEGLLRDIRAAVRGVNADLPLARVRTLNEFYDRSMARTSFTLVMLGLAGAMAFVLGLIGLYGVLAYSVAQRRREVGIRMALGAEPGAVRRMFVAQGLFLAGVGVAIGLIAAIGLSRFISSFLFGIRPFDPLTYATAAAALLTAAIVASYLPAFRAGRVNPMETLRSE